MKIKIRAWDGEKMVSPDYVDRNGLAWWRENSIPTTSKETMLHTGLKDIYELDIVRDSMGTYVVEWDCRMGRFHLGIIYDEPQDSIHETHKSIYTDAMMLTVIGNIYENPELVNQ
jgi:hypothetical protein